MSKIIGLSFGYHDACVAVLEQGRILGVYSEERFSRRKHDNRFPRKALRHAVMMHNLVDLEIEAVCYYEDPVLKLLRQRDQFKTVSQFAHYVDSKGLNLDPISQICDFLEIVEDKVYVVEHHISHAFTACCMSKPLQSYSRLALTIDGVGEYDCTCLTRISAERDEVSVHKKTISKFPDSLGLFYSAFTSYLGFEVNDAEFKVMGLASYGEATYSELIRGLIKANSDCISIKEGVLSTEWDSENGYSKGLVEALGEPAPNSKKYAEDFKDIESVMENTELKRFADTAASLQNTLVDIVKELARSSVQDDGPLFYGGGVALNTKANYEILRKGIQLYIPPDPGDGGSALGCAVAYSEKAGYRGAYLCDPYLGLKVDDTDVFNVSEELSMEEMETEEMLIFRAVEYLISGGVIGWVQGRAEFGPRALGNRSILANPRTRDMQEFVNTAVKFRESFRPFAPAILSEHITHLINTTGVDMSYDNHPIDYMLSTFPVKEEAYNKIAACIHVDGTSRVQRVTEKRNGIFYRLIKRFYEETEIPALLNTSFNLRGEPIVNSADDAVSTFKSSDLSALFIGHKVITKK